MSNRCIRGWPRVEMTLPEETEAGSAGKQPAKGYCGLRCANGVSGSCRLIPNGVNLGILWCNFWGLFRFLPASMAGSGLFEFRVFCVSTFDSARLVAAGAIAHKV